MKELQLCVTYPMPLDFEKDRQINLYLEQHGFKFLGSGSDGDVRDLEFRGSIELLKRPGLFTVWNWFLCEGMEILLKYVERSPSVVTWTR